MAEKPIGAGKSSYDLITPKLLFDALAPDRDLAFLDVACGVGNYSLAAAEILTENSTIFAIDLWPEGISSLLAAVSQRQLTNVWATVGDISQRIPLNDQTTDICLMATVLHDLVEVQTQHGALKEIARVLKPQGLLAIIEFKKIEGPPGPPVDIRLSAEAVEDIVAPYGFIKDYIIDVGPYNYLAGYVLR